MTRAVRVGLGLAALAASPAMALDCQRAATPSEKAICADPIALAADSDLGKAFDALRASLDPKGRTQLVAAQVAWLGLRDSNCADEKGPALGACLARETRARVAFLAGAPEAGPGAPGRLAPVFRMQKGGKGRTDVDVQLLKFVDAATPAERAFNAAVDRLTNDLENPGKDDPLADQWSYMWSMRMAYASPRLISAHADGDSFMGGAHPNSYSVNVNIDGARGREATFADMLDKPAADKIFALCLKQVRDQKSAREGSADDDSGAPKTLAESVAEATADLKAWSFGADAATVSYDPYAVGAYVEGAFSCSVPYATLRPSARADFPLP
ncbi:MAG: lysozyme inhibitor LprI family protein [Roseiarcus sp.]|jgi:uncharacterized protein YecT (DUF1311 family)|uniref:DUF3298 domain-containing protein n=1 Tax=Roseiarcus sp. TaxID=1969460 RepID=UPI003C196BCE